MGRKPKQPPVIPMPTLTEAELRAKMALAKAKMARGRSSTMVSGQNGDETVLKPPPMMVTGNT